MTTKTRKEDENGRRDYRRQKPKKGVVVLLRTQRVLPGTAESVLPKEQGADFGREEETEEG
jgi:hypothetical protein